MPRIPDGGFPITTLVTVAASPSAPTMLAPIRDGASDKMRSALIIQNVGTTIVYVGGAGVGAATSSTQGLLLAGVPDPQTTPPTQPKSLSLATTPQAVYAICDSGSGGGSVVVYEEVS